MIKTALTADALTSLVNTGTEPETTIPLVQGAKRHATEQVESDNSKYIQYKHSGKVFNIASNLKVSGSKQISVKLEPEDYTMLRHCADRTGLNHREIMLEGFDLWIRQNVAKLK